MSDSLHVLIGPGSPQQTKVQLKRTKLLTYMQTILLQTQHKNTKKILISWFVKLSLVQTRERLSQNTKEIYHWHTRCHIRTQHENTEKILISWFVKLSLFTHEKGYFEILRKFITMAYSQPHYGQSWFRVCHSLKQTWASFLNGGLKTSSSNVVSLETLCQCSKSCIHVNHPQVILEATTLLQNATCTA